MHSQPREGRQNPFPHQRHHPIASPSHRKTKRISRKVPKRTRTPPSRPSPHASVSGSASVSKNSEGRTVSDPDAPRQKL
jgi:hypothetical protein